MENNEIIKLREYLKVLLSIGTHEIVFKKKDGSIRVMKSTRDIDIIPDEKSGKNPRVNLVNLAIYETQLNEWRSFALENLIGFDGINIDELKIKAQLV